MNGWAGFWIALAIIEFAEAYRWIKKKEFEYKYKKQK